MAADLFLYRNKPTPAGACQKYAAGFTLIELISVVAIISILTAIVIPSYRTYIQRAQIARAIVEIRMIDQSITRYRDEQNRLPGSLADVGHGDLKDPWRNSYRYLNIADGGLKGKGKQRRDRFLNPLNTDYDLYSMGFDGKSASQLNAQSSRDDVVRVLNGGFIGLATDF